MMARMARLGANSALPSLHIRTQLHPMAPVVALSYRGWSVRIENLRFFQVPTR